MTLPRLLIASLIALLGVVVTKQVQRSDVPEPASPVQEEHIITLSDLNEAWLSEGDAQETLVWVNGAPINRAQLKALRVHSRPEHPSWLILQELVTLVALQQELLDDQAGAPLTETPRDLKEAQRWLQTLNIALEQAFESSAPVTETVTSNLPTQTLLSPAQASVSRTLLVLSIPYQAQGSEGERASMKARLEEIRLSVAQQRLTMTQALERYSPRSSLFRGLVTTSQGAQPVPTALEEALERLALGSISDPVLDAQGGYLVQLLSQTRAPNPMELEAYTQRRARAEQRRVDHQGARADLARRLMLTAQLKLSPAAALKTPPRARHTRLKLIAPLAELNTPQP